MELSGTRVSGGDRARLVKLAKAARELSLREERSRQGELRGGLIHFVRYFWHVLEPERKLVEGWPLEALCVHLEAISRGEFNRFLGNVPPGFMKSLLVNVFWPAWEWGALKRTHLRYLSFSYAAHLTERDNRKFLTILQSQIYREMYPHVKLRKAGETLVMNDNHGFKLATSVGGVGTGERADRILCFPGDQVVQTEQGPVAIGDIVKRRMRVRVWSRDIETGRDELKPVVGWRHNPGSRLVAVKFSDGGEIVCTPDHRIRTSFGWVQAARLHPGNVVPCAPVFDLADVLSRGVEPASDVNHSPTSHKYGFDNFGVQLRGGARVVGSAPNSATSVRKPKVSPRGSLEDAADGRYADVEVGRNHPRNLATAGINLTHKIVGQMVGAVSEVAMRLAVGDVLRPRAVLQVARACVRSVSVLVSDLVSFRAWSDKGRSHYSMNHYVFSDAIYANGHSGVALQQYGSENSLGYREMPGLAFRRSRDAFDAAKAGNKVIRSANNSPPLFREVVSVDDGGHANETFCLTVEKNHNFYCGSRQEISYLVANCDDPHNVHDAESDAVRSRTVTWFREAMSNRLNDSASAIVVIMQRVHEADVSGEILNEGLPYVHLCIPWEYDSSRRCVTPVWEDPRSVDGEPAWLDRFPEADLASFRGRPVMWSGQYQQSPEPRGGNIFRRDYWEPWTGKTYPNFDFILGSLDSAFTAKETNDPSGFTIWGLYRDPKTGEPRVMLVMAWRKFLEIRGKRVERMPGETTPEYNSRTQKDWGLIEWVAYSCRKHKVEKLLVEAKASGLSVIQEIGKLYHGEGWNVEPVIPDGDKVNRAHAVVGSFAEGLVSAPAIVDESGALAWRPWVQLVIDEMAIFPGGARKDLTDSATQALRWLRRSGMLQFVREAREAERAELEYRRPTQPLYPSI